MVTFGRGIAEHVVRPKTCGTYFMFNPKEHGISDPLYTGIKTVSRRSWSNKHAATWIKAYREGRIIHDAWSNAPFVKGARKIGTFQLICEPYLEYLRDMPQTDAPLEGGFWNTAQDYIDQFSNGDDNQKVWVIRWQDFRPTGI